MESKLRELQEKLAIEEADKIVIGPSNPILSIGPILSIQNLKEKNNGGLLWEYYAHYASIYIDKHSL